MKRSLPATLLVAVLLVVVSACTSRDAATLGCLDGSRPTHVITPPNQTRYSPSQDTVFADHTTLDARGVTFNDSTLNTSGYGVGIKLYAETGSRDDMCLVGGSIKSSLDAQATLWDTWHKVTGLTVLTSNFQVVGTHFFNQGDAISFPTDLNTNWKVIGVDASGAPGSAGAYIHDDCVEDDAMNAGLVDDSKFDGCGSSFLSADSTPNHDGGANLVEVTDTLVRLQSMYNSFDPAKYGYNRHGGFFKWAGDPSVDGVPPMLYVHDSTFRADSPAAFAGNANGWLALPPNTRCNNVTLINTASWPARDLASWTSQCTNVTFGTTADWNAKVAAWDAAHPSM